MLAVSGGTVMTAALARAPRQLDIIADTALARRENGGQLSTAPPLENGGYLSIVGLDENGSHSSTPAAPENGSHSSTGFAAFDRRRQRLDISVMDLCAAAGVHHNTYRFAKEGHVVTRPGTMAKLQKALNALAAGEGADEPRTLCQATLRLLTVFIAREVGADPARVLAQNFDHERPSDPAWVLASRMRRCAIYVAVEVLAIGKAKIGHALGVSRQAIHSSVVAIEGERISDPAFDALIARVSEQVKP